MAKFVELHSLQLNRIWNIIRTTKGESETTSQKTTLTAGLRLYAVILFPLQFYKGLLDIEYQIYILTYLPPPFLLLIPMDPFEKGGLPLLLLYLVVL